MSDPPKPSYDELAARDAGLNAYILLMRAISALGRLIRQAWTLYRWDVRPKRRP